MTSDDDRAREDAAREAARKAERDEHNRRQAEQRAADAVIERMRRKGTR